MTPNKILPCIWFAADGGQLANIIAYYKAVFEPHFQTGTIIPLGNTPNGNAELCEVEFLGLKYSLMSTASEHQPLNDAVSFIIQCEDQKEIDHYWDYFTQEGEASQCGWCIDKYGLRWQIIPKNLAELMSRPNAGEVVMRQQKIIIEEYLR